MGRVVQGWLSAGVGLSSEWVLAFERFEVAQPDGRVAQFVAVQRSTGELVPLPVLGDPQYEMCC
jgi:hypothetical protein